MTSVSSTENALATASEVQHSGRLPNFADVIAASLHIAPKIRRTPLWRIPGTSVLLKREDLQNSGPFKLRGAANAFAVASPNRMVAASSGNHGKAVAILARDRNFRAIIVMTGHSMAEKMERIRELGASVRLVEGGVVERNHLAESLAKDLGATLVPPSDHPDVIAGQATMGLEIAAEALGIEAIYVPVGGGGLLAGICLAKRAWTDTGEGKAPDVIGVEPGSAPRYALSVASGKVVTVPPSGSIADGLRSQTPGRIALPIAAAGTDRFTTVDDYEILRTMALLREHGIMAEPSSAAAVAAALRVEHTRDVVAILSGGNISRARSDALIANAGQFRNTPIVLHTS